MLKVLKRTSVELLTRGGRGPIHMRDESRRGGYLMDNRAPQSEVVLGLVTSQDIKILFHKPHWYALHIQACGKCQDWILMSKSSQTEAHRLSLHARIHGYRVSTKYVRSLFIAITSS